ncbi:probable ethylene response sensor 1 [Aristolochia californica]|uniref:probable ethylene response sensor 1 n=1 Tax=Aristolochia californica TaxID=171875 RepID=UPI0035D7DBA0
MDFLTAIVYFFIPLTINWMIRKFPLNPNKSVLMLLGVFTVTSGIAELMSLGMCPPRFETVAEVLAFVKLSSACVLLATVLMLFRLTPESEQLRIYEQTLKRRAVEVDQMLGHLRAQKAVDLRYRHMIQELSSSPDKYDILRTAVSELGKNLDLGECGLWMPTDNGSKLLLCRTFRNQMTVGIAHSVKDSVYSDGYAVVVLMFPVAGGGRRWREHEMELVDSIIQQVAIALSHASIVEESIQFHDRLREHSFYLEMKAENAERVLCLHRDFVTIMSKLMQMPMESLSASTSLLQETSLTSPQHLMVEDISRTTRFLSDMITDVSEFLGIEGGSIQFNLNSLNLHLFLQEPDDIPRRPDKIGGQYR